MRKYLMNSFRKAGTTWNRNAAATLRCSKSLNCSFSSSSSLPTLRALGRAGSTTVGSRVEGIVALFSVLGLSVGIETDKVEAEMDLDEAANCSDMNAMPYITKKWYFYKGKLTPDNSKNVKVFKCHDTPIADEVAEYLGVKLGKMSVANYADGETSIELNEGVRGQNVYIICSTSSVDRIMELLLSIAASRRASAKTITAVIPFYGYGRQDCMAKGREPISAADIARMLEVVGVDRVIAVDLHSAQIEGFFGPGVPVDNLRALPVGAVYFSEMNLKDPVVVAPHSTAVYRAEKFRQTMDKLNDEEISLAMLVKKHNTDKTTPSELVGDVKGKDCILVDTLVDTGRTLVDAAKLLKQSGARRVFAFAVHGRFSSNAMQRIRDCDEIELLVTTNTLPFPESTDEACSKENDKIRVLSIAPLVADAIASVQTKKAISTI